MNADLLALLRCPRCSGTDLALEPLTSAGDQVRDGRLSCRGCGAWFRIEGGVVDLLPLDLRRHELHQAFCRRFDLPCEEPPPAPADHAQKKGQIAFFREDMERYEREVVARPFWKALDRLCFLDWMERRLQKDELVLDLGCGTGRQSVPLAQHGQRVVGIDLTEEMVARAQQRLDELGLSSRALLVVGDAEDPPVRDAAFRACIIYGALHHVPDPARCLARASRKLAPGGLIYTLDPHASSVRFLFDGLMKLWKLYEEEANDHPLFSEDKLRGWLEASGFEAEIRLKTFVPPHLLYLLPTSVDASILRVTDAVMGRIPGVRTMAGVITAEGRRVD